MIKKSDRPVRHISKESPRTNSMHRGIRTTDMPLSHEEYRDVVDNGWNYRNGHDWISCHCPSCIELCGVSARRYW